MGSGTTFVMLLCHKLLAVLPFKRNFLFSDPINSALKTPFNWIRVYPLSEESLVAVLSIVDYLQVVFAAVECCIVLAF